ncbi:LysR family transcriptional regulator [Rhodopirellula sp. SWK7]|uniref:LysR family transcriptional regulator n=1 Tax=Rhodopirellula sp. SWK7 TaxID=595460 RepID=UPI0002BE9E34|nr:LysR family transcriptional regulator [Rhodopirellula sp. SWK7]EMI43400.1 transcriptional regulator, LysR family [Rhodopirellula sp. SWK7]
MSKRRYYKQVRVSQYRSLLTVARLGGFAAAAEQLELSTPSVWQQIRALENEFEVSLVEVDGQHVSLTEEGDLLAQLAGPVVLGFDSIQEEFSQQCRSVQKKLSVASPSNVLITELSAPIVEYQACYPDVELKLIDAASNPARALLEAGEVDLAVVGQLQTDFPVTLEYDLVAEFPFMLVCPKDHPVLELKRITPKALARFPLVMSLHGTNTRARVDEVFESTGVASPLRVACETSTKGLQLQYIELGFGIGIIPISPQFLKANQSVFRDPRNLVFRDVSKFFGIEHIVILRRKRRREPIHQHDFRDVVLRKRLEVK